MEVPFVLNPELLLATLAQLFANDGKAREVAVLANAQTSLEWYSHDNWDDGIDIYNLHLQIPIWLYGQVGSDLDECIQCIQDKAQIMLRPYRRFGLNNITISPAPVADEKWREKAIAWTTGEGVTNQGRVRSDNVAARASDGLLFRSEQEILLYKALKAIGISFAPLPVFIRGGTEYKRIEPDFVIIKDGIVMIVELDGDTVHHETPAEAHSRTTMLIHEGAHIERVKASECATPDAASTCARRIVQVVEKLKTLR